MICVSDTHEKSGFGPRDDSQTENAFPWYATLNTSTKWVDEPGMKRIGSVTVSCNRGETSTIAMSFGSTEISAKATNDKTRQKGRALIAYNFNSL